MLMLKRILAPLVLAAALAGAGPVLAAEPTVHQVYEAARSGHLEEAQQMMNQVLRDHPDSAEAHYVEAQLSARAANFPRARAELAKAQQLDPSGAFATPQALASLQRELARGSAYGQPGYRTAPVVREQSHSSFGYWPIILLVIAGVVIGWALLSRRNPPQYGGYPQYPGGVPPAGGPGGGYGVPPGYGPAGYGAPMGGGMGSGIVGGLASGLAIGAGVAAGEELVHHWIDRDGNRVEGPPPPGYVPPPDDNPNMGGNDFGVSDNSSWDSGGGGDFGTSDSGGGGGDDWT